MITPCERAGCGRHAVWSCHLGSDRTIEACPEHAHRLLMGLDAAGLDGYFERLHFLPAGVRAS